jgi:hypothetical protein
VSENVIVIQPTGQVFFRHNTGWWEDTPAGYVNVPKSHVVYLNALHADVRQIAELREEMQGKINELAGRLRDLRAFQEMLIIAHENLPRDDKQRLTKQELAALEKVTGKGIRARKIMRGIARKLSAVSPPLPPSA